MSTSGMLGSYVDMNPHARTHVRTHAGMVQKACSKAGAAAVSTPSAKKEGRGASGGEEADKGCKTADEAEMDADVDEDKDGQQSVRPSYLGV